MPENYSAKELDEQKEKIKADLLGAVTHQKIHRHTFLPGSRWRARQSSQIYSRGNTTATSSLFRVMITESIILATENYRHHTQKFAGKMTEALKRYQQK